MRALPWLCVLAGAMPTETLYAGIRLPSSWPPRLDERTAEPTTPPYHGPYAIPFSDGVWYDPKDESTVDYSLRDGVSINAGGIDVPVRWRNANGYELPRGQQVRLEFQLKNAKLYSFWME